MQHPTAFAKWLLGLSGAGTGLAVTFYIHSYLSILSINKNDCVSLRFVAAAISGAAKLALWFGVSGTLAVAAISCRRRWALGGTFDVGTKLRNCRRYSRDMSSMNGPIIRSRDG